MTSSSFQTSRLKTVSKRPRRSFPLCRCVFVHVLALVFGCVSTSVCVCVCFFSLSLSPRLVCLYSGRVHVAVCVFPCLSVPSPLLTQVLSGELQQSCGSADRCMSGGLYPSLSLCLFVYICLSLPSVTLTTTEILLHCDLFA